VRGADEIRRRVEELDGVSSDLSHFETQNKLKAFVDLMASVTNGYVSGRYGEAPLLDPETADELVVHCASMGILRRKVPSLTTRSIDVNNQIWVATSRISRLTSTKPSKNSFIGVAHPKNIAKTKPIYGGLYTSTLLPDVGKSMWRIYLDLHGHSSVLYPKPWVTYKLRPTHDVRAFEVNSAKQWVGLIDQFHVTREGLQYPDWEQIARRYDAIHMTIDAILGIQGLRLNSPGGVTAETYWDVETTLWLNWCFESVDLVV
jgi:hypothetical protein